MTKHEKDKETDGRSSSIFIVSLRRIKKTPASCLLGESMHSLSVTGVEENPPNLYLPIADVLAMLSFHRLDASTEISSISTRFSIVNSNCNRKTNLLCYGNQSVFVFLSLFSLSLSVSVSISATITTCSSACSCVCKKTSINKRTIAMQDKKRTGNWPCFFFVFFSLRVILHACTPRDAYFYLCACFWECDGGHWLYLEDTPRWNVSGENEKHLHLLRRRCPHLSKTTHLRTDERMWRETVFNQIFDSAIVCFSHFATLGTAQRPWQSSSGSGWYFFKRKPFVLDFIIAVLCVWVRSLDGHLMRWSSMKRTDAVRLTTRHSVNNVLRYSSILTCRSLCCHSIRNDSTSIIQEPKSIVIIDTGTLSLSFTSTKQFQRAISPRIRCHSWRWKRPCSSSPCLRMFEQRSTEIFRPVRNA